MTSLPRHWGRVLDAAGLIVAAVAVPLWSTSSPVVVVFLFAAGVALMVIRPRAMLGRPRIWRRVKPPQQNVGGPLEGDDGRFLGR